MNPQEMSKLAAQLAQFVIDSGELDDEDDREWWLMGLGAAVGMEADSRGLTNASELADEAVRLWRGKRIALHGGAKPKRDWDEDEGEAE